MSDFCPAPRRFDSQVRFFFWEATINCIACKPRVAALLFSCVLKCTILELVVFVSSRSGAGEATLSGVTFLSWESLLWFPPMLRLVFHIAADETPAVCRAAVSLKCFFLWCSGEKNPRSSSAAIKRDSVFRGAICLQLWGRRGSGGRNQRRIFPSWSILLQHGRRDVAEVTVVNTMAIGPFLFLMIFRKGFENK